MITKIENIPQELKEVNNWVCWVGTDKVPKSPYNGKNAQSNNPKTWGTFNQAVKACETFQFDGIGFMFAPPYFGVDLDHCLDNKEFVDEFVETLGSYTEVSKSGAGIHIICRGTLPNGKRRKGKVEMYADGRYFICTGNVYNDKYKEVIDCTDTIKVLHSKYLPSDAPQMETAKRFIAVDFDDAEVIEKASTCKSGDVFKMLYEGKWQGVYPSQSEADLALCEQLAFWTQKNEGQMDRIFRSSALMRDKWDKKRGSQTYGQITIGKACAYCIDVYEPKKYSDDTSLAFAIFGDKKVGIQQEEKKHYDMTDTGNAHRLVDKFGSIIRYSYNRKKWFYWSDNKVWKEDTSGEIKKMADVICEDIKREGFLEQDEEEQALILKWANKTASSKGKEAMIKEAQHIFGIPASPDDFDAYTDYLNCQNGIVNLRNGELIPHEAKFMMSKICLTEYETGKAQPKMWLKFLDDVTNHDKDLQEYIQRCIGYSLSGSNEEQCAYFLYGIGNNGKSTFLDTISDMLGGYASNTQPETIMMQKYNSGASSDIARLKSARFVTCEEPTEGVRLNEGLLKQLTGGSKITCRFLYGDDFEYTPEFKIWIATNHKPVIRGTDVGIWRRIRLIPFEVNIPKEKVDKNMKYKLRQEFPQILRWAVEGYIKWRKYGMNEPKRVIDATQEYKNEMDLLASFLEQCVEIDYDSKDKVPASDLFRIYSMWAKVNNEYEMSSNKFFREVGKKLPEKGRNASGVFFPSIKFTEYALSLTGANRGYRFEDFY